MKPLDLIKKQYTRLRWIFQHYNEIVYDSETFAPSKGHLHGKVTYKADGLITSTNCDFIHEPRFKKAYQAAADTNPWPNFTLQWRVYIVCWMADHVKNLEGDFVECGVNTGAYAKAIMQYVDFDRLNKTFYLLDTFEGLVAGLITQEEKKLGIDKYLGSYSNVYEKVKQAFAEHRAEIIKGAVPGTLPLCRAEKVAYLSIDMNCVEPEIAAAGFFWDKMVPGGVIVLDDYGFAQHIHQKTAFDKFAREKNVSILSLPTGQGIIFKP
jgi:O-methyltransferase